MTITSNANTNEVETIPLSALNQYAYCPRRCYLILMEGEFEDNVHTFSGSMEHERVDQLKYEIKDGVRVEYGLPVWSDKLGLSGRCDGVEFHPDGSIYPVEYKHGKRRRWLNDDLQLAAQALCLEEMTGKRIAKGAIYHQKSKRRREVTMTEALRTEVIITVQAIRKMLENGVCPPPTEDSRRCPECSLKPLCQPELIRAKEKIRALTIHLFDSEDENTNPKNAKEKS